MPKKPKNNRKKLIDSGNYNLSTGEVEEGPQVEFRSLTLRKTQALEYLNGANMPSKFRFRESQIQKIEQFIQACLKKEKKGYRFLMVTGSPGAGKTLSLNSVLSRLDCEVIRLNANILKSVADVQLLENTTPRTAPQILRQLQQAKYDKNCVICIEQIELLFKSAPGIISEDFLQLFLKKSVNLILVGISNTIDTLQKYSGKYSFKVSEIENIVFAPYRAEHIMSILQDKITHLKEKFNLNVEFPEKLLKFSSQKLQTLKKGDFRICLEFLKEVIRLAFFSGEKDQQQSSRFVISIGMINQTFSKMNISKNELMQKLPYQQIIILIGLHNIIVKTDGLFVSLKDLNNELKWICGSLQVSYNASLMDERLNDLQQYGIVQVKRKNNNETRVILQVSSDEIKNTFGDNQLLGKYIVNNE